MKAQFSWAGGGQECSAPDPYAIHHTCTFSLPACGSQEAPDGLYHGLKNVLLNKIPSQAGNSQATTPSQNDPKHYRRLQVGRNKWLLQANLS